MSISRNLTRSVLALACLTIVLAPVPLKAQTSALSVVMVQTNTVTATAGWPIGISTLVANYSSSKVRGKVTLTLQSPCSTTATTIGYSNLALSPGQGTWVTLSYPIPSAACS